MATPTLTELRAQRDKVRSAMDELSANPAITVTIDGMTLTRPTIAQLRRQLIVLQNEINRRESGGVAPFDQSIRWTTGATWES